MTHASYSWRPWLDSGFWNVKSSEKWTPDFIYEYKKCLSFFFLIPMSLSLLHVPLYNAQMGYLDHTPTVSWLMLCVIVNFDFCEIPAECIVASWVDGVRKSMLWMSQWKSAPQSPRHSGCLLIYIRTVIILSRSRQWLITFAIFAQKNYKKFNDD